MDAATISKDNCCDLGKWLHGEAKIKFARRRAIRSVLLNMLHSMPKPVKLPAMLNAGTSYMAASNSVGGATR